MIPPRPHIAAMAPYALARMEPPPGKPLISLAQNESLRPPSPAVLDALKAAHPAETYPDPDWTACARRSPGCMTSTPPCILCGAGSLDLIACLARAYAGPDRAVLAPAHAYPFFRAAAQMAEARFDTAPEEDFTVSVDALLDAVRPDTGLLFLANPGNPTGTRIPASEIRRLRDALRETSCWSSTRPMASSQTLRTRPSSTSWTGATRSSCAPSPRPMASPGCASAGVPFRPPSRRSFARS
jgi:histidinol-phosphate aminotransferase